MIANSNRFFGPVQRRPRGGPRAAAGSLRGARGAAAARVAGGPRRLPRVDRRAVAARFPLENRRRGAVAAGRGTKGGGGDRDVIACFASSALGPSGIESA